MIKPTVGRMVWYYQNPLVYKGSLVKQRAAIICYVHDDGLINLSVFDEQGHSYPALGVQLVQEGEETPSNYYATWMPYQIGQAKKTEELIDYRRNWRPLAPQGIPTEQGMKPQRQVAPQGDTFEAPCDTSQWDKA